MAGPGVQLRPHIGDRQTRQTHPLRSAFIPDPRDPGSRVQCPMELRKSGTHRTPSVWTTSPGAATQTGPSCLGDRAETESASPRVTIAVCRTPNTKLSEVAGGLQGPRNFKKYFHKYLQRKGCSPNSELLVIDGGLRVFPSPTRFDLFPLIGPILHSISTSTFSQLGSS